MKVWKRCLSLLLTLSMVLTLLPVSVLATKLEESEAVEEAVEQGDVETVEEPAYEEEVSPEEIAGQEGVPAAQGSSTEIASGTCGENLTWTLTTDGTLTISGTGEMEDYWDPPWYPYVDDILYINIEHGVQSIGKSAFLSCYLVESIEIPASVSSIGMEAFLGCTELFSIEVEEGNPFFCSLDGILYDKSISTLIKYPSMHVEDKVYTLPASIDSIVEDALTDTFFLQMIEVEDGNDFYCSIDGVLFTQDMTALIRCPGGYVRESCVVPDGVVTICDDAFLECSNITSIHIPDGVEYIGGNAFSYCEKLSSIIIPASVNYFGPCAFTGCTELKTAGPIGSGSSYEFGWTEYIPFNAFDDCEGLKSVTLPMGLKEIGGHAFGNYVGLERIEIPATVTNIGEGVFDDWSKLTSVYFGGNAPTIAGVNEDWPSFPASTVLYYLQDKTGWTDSEYYDAANGTWNGYQLRTWEPNVYRIKNLQSEPILVNGSGQATALFQLNDYSKVPLAGRVVSYSLNGITGSAVTDGNGVFKVKAPAYRSGFYTVECQVKGFDGELIGAEQTFSVKGMPLSYVQKWTGTLGVSAGVGLDLGLGGSVGAASAEASLAKAMANAGISGQFSLEDSYENGSRTMELTYTYDPSAGVEFKSGMEATIPGTVIRPFGTSAGATLHAMASSGIKIENYDPSNMEQLEKIGAFNLQSALMGVNSVWSQVILDLLDVGFHNQSAYTTKAVLGAGASIGLFEQTGGGTVSIAGGDVSTIYSTTGETDKVDNTYTQSIELTYDKGGGFIKGLIPGVNGYFLGCEESNSMKMSVISDRDSNLQGLSYKLYEEGKKDISWFGITEETAKTITYNIEEMGKIIQDQEDLRRYIEGDKWILSPIEMALSGQNAFSGDYQGILSHTTNQKEGLDLDLDLDVEFGAGVELGLKGSFISEVEFEDRSGLTFGGQEYITSESFVTLEEVVARKKVFAQIMSEPIKAVAHTVMEYFESAADGIKDGVSNFFASLKSSAGNLFAEIKAFGNQKTRSYAILALENAVAEETNAAVAVTIGSPYTVSLYTDETMETAATEAQAAQAGVTLTLGYDSAMLASAGAPADADINIYRFDYDRNMYACLSNCVQDKEACTVTAPITQGGEYILATDSASPLISDFETSNETPTPTIYALVSDLSGIGEFQFWLDGQETLVDTANFEKYYDSTSGLFTYPVNHPLAEGQHTAYFQAADTLGNENAVPFSFTFQVDGKAPVISDVEVPAGDISDTAGFAVTAAVTDDSQISQVILCTSDENGETGNLTMTQENGKWTAQVTNVAGAGTISLQVVAYDFAGNRSESQIFTVQSSVPANPTGIVLSADWTGEGTADVTVSNHEYGAFGGWLLCVVYDENGRMLDLANAYVGLDGKESITQSMSFGCDPNLIYSGKVMLLDVAGGYSPICETGLF